jgi:hypothetical protein
MGRGRRRCTIPQQQRGNNFGSAKLRPYVGTAKGIVAAAGQKVEQTPFPEYQGFVMARCIGGGGGCTRDGNHGLVVTNRERELVEATMQKRVVVWLCCSCCELTRCCWTRGPSCSCKRPGLFGIVRDDWTRNSCGPFSGRPFPC